jgi:aspartate aminotransferase
MRLGILATYNTELHQNALKFAMSRSGTSRIEQRISIPLLTEGTELVTRNHRELCARIEAAVQALKEIPGVELFEPQGGMFVIVKIPGINTQDLLRFFLNTFRHEGQTVSFLSLEDFYISNDQGKEELRIAAIYPAEKMKEAIEIFKQGLNAYRSQ